MSWVERLRRRAGSVLWVLALTTSSAAVSSANAQPAAPAPDKAKEPTVSDPKIEDEIVETRGTLRIAGVDLRYTARTGTMVMRDEEGKAKAKVFFVAYTRDGADAAKRPVTFTFNGGPGSSSVWLHMGAFGPQRVDLGEEGFAPPPPYRLVANEGSILDVTDLVFIDPVTTGFSRAVPVEQDDAFHGVRGDIESVGDFVRLWTTRYARWNSPKFLAGESYGTTRAAGLAGYLQRRHGMFLNGVVLVSAVLDFATGDFHPGHDLPYPLFLPTYTATAWYHGRLPADLQAKELRAVLDEAEAFAREEYPQALWLGDRLPQAQRDGTLDRLARLTGLDRALLDRWNLRIDDGDFFRELLADRNELVGRLDSRFKTPVVRGAEGGGLGGDPSYDNILGPYTATLNAYVRETLRFESDLPYEILTGRVRPWRYDDWQNRFLNVAPTLAAAMRQNPGLKVLVANGYYDVATPYHATEYTFDRLGLPPALRENVSMTYYPGGHMMYIDRRELLRLREDLVAFYRSAIPDAAGK